MINTFWSPDTAIDPIEHAAVVLEVCEGNLGEAQELCFNNILLDPQKSNYWRLVLGTLCSSGHA